MRTAYTYRDTLALSERTHWRVEDIIGGPRRLDFTRNFLPEALVDAQPLTFLGESEQRTLNHIRSHSYLSIFGLVEEFILPFVLDHARTRLTKDDAEVRALLQFAGEEAKHIDLFRRFRSEFEAGFGSHCGVVGPGEALAEAVLAHASLGIALVILQIEWMTQKHYVESAKDDTSLDQQFTSLLEHHWMEEAQHAKLDTLIVLELAKQSTPADIQAGLQAYEAIGKILEDSLIQQVRLDLESFGVATGRALTPKERAAFVEVQERSYRRCFLEAGAQHPKFLQTRRSLELM